MYRQTDEIQALKAAIADAGRTLIEKGLVSGTAGNVSARLPGGDVLLVTPSGIPYAAITPDDIVVLDIATGDRVDGARRPSVETPIHLGMMRRRLDVNAAIHTHSTFASAVAGSHQDIPPFLDSMSSLLGGPLRVADHAPSGSQQMQDAIGAKLADTDAVLLANHGAFVVGPSLDAALGMAEFVEQVCQIYVYSRLIGGPVPLPEEDVRRERHWYLTAYGQKPSTA